MQAASCYFTFKVTESEFRLSMPRFELYHGLRAAVGTSPSLPIAFAFCPKRLYLCSQSLPLPGQTNLTYQVSVEREHSFTSAVSTSYKFSSENPG